MWDYNIKIENWTYIKARFFVSGPLRIVNFTVLPSGPLFEI